jgi:putative DNA primase/helicase
MLDTVLSKFHSVRKSGDQFIAKCPAHDDQEPSLSITMKDGKALLHCHAGCSVEAVLAAVSLSPNDLFPSKPRKIPQRKRTIAVYDYRDESGELVFQAVRYEPKSFRYRRPDGGGGYEWNLAGVRLVPYRLPELLAADRDFPVFIVEGEKDADALRAIGVTATCNPMGALKWMDEYSEHLRGYDCVILPDNDDTGRRHAQMVVKSLFGKAELVSILELPGLPEKGDVYDWLAAGGTREDLFALLSGAEVIESGPETPKPLDDELPENFRLTGTGLYYSHDGKETLLSGPLKVVADTCDRDNLNWGKIVEFRDRKGVEHDLVIPMSALSGDAVEVRRMLMDAGLQISGGRNARQYFLEYLLTASPHRHVTTVRQLGWHDGAFVFPDAVICSGGTERTMRLQTLDRGSNKFRTSGTLEGWQAQIGRYCVGNSRLIFAVSVAFAAALLPIAEEPSGGFHIYGHSSTGKTTALLISGSVWGGGPGKGFLETWRATANGLEAVAELHNHSLLLLDEISQVNPHEVGQVIYSLSNGFGKSRMNKTMTSRPKSEWNLTFLSSGEKTLDQVVSETNQRSFGGQEARFVNIEADAGCGLGLFDQLQGFASGSDLSKHLSAASSKHYGAPIRRFLEQVCGNQSAALSRIRELRQYFTTKLHVLNAAGEVYRVASRFALVAAGGVLASEFGVTGWDRAEPFRTSERIFEEWLNLRGTAGSHDVARGVRQVLGFIEQHGGGRFQTLTDSTHRVPNRAGFKRESFEGHTEYLILKEVFEREVCRGFHHVSVARELERLGHLRRGTEKGYLTSRETLPELGRTRAYLIAAEPIFAQGPDPID